VGQAVARVQAPATLIESSLTEFAKVLPSSVDKDKFGRWALTCLKNALNDTGNPKQVEAWGRVLNPANEAGRLSVMSALMDAAALGLEPGREYHLIPFGSVVTGITDYKGEIKLITNYCPSAVIAMLVHEQDDFHMTGANIPPKHDADWFGDRGPVTGGYSFVDYGGERYSLVTRMPEAEFLKHREVAKTKAVWDAWPDQMRVKTLVHGTRKLVPWSVERMW
jgi:recombinational DNA repair protein RecT